MQHYTRIPVAISDAGSAAVAHKRGLIEVPYGAHPFSPSIAAPHVEIPVHVKTLVSPIADEMLRLAPKVTFHVGN